MKKLLGLVLTLGLLLALCAPALAADAVVASPQSLSVDGAPVLCEKYNIGGRNYFKLRDLAQLLDGTGSSFNVSWDAEAGMVSITTRHPYTTPDGHELEPRGDLSATAVKSAQTIRIDGRVRTDLDVWNIGGSNFFQLRELGLALGFAVDYDDGSDTALVGSVANPAHVYLGVVGGTINADLDGDGIENAVRVWMEKQKNEYGYDYINLHLSIDGKDFTDALCHLDSPDSSLWAITDLDMADGLLEIAIQDWGPSSDLTTAFFRFDGNELSYIGSPGGFLAFLGGSAEMTLNGDGTLESEMRLHVVQTWWANVTYAIGDDGLLAPIPQDFYASTYENQYVFIQETLYCYDVPGGTRQTIFPPITMQLIGTDNHSWVKLLYPNGKETWLHLVDDFGWSLESPTGPIIVSEALEGLCMAD